MHRFAGDQANQQMVDRLIAEGSLWSSRLIAAFRATPRHRFLDRFFQYQRKRGTWREVLTRDPGPEELSALYTDRALITRLSPPSLREAVVPISSSSQPSLMARMLEDLRLEPGQRVLEIGAGSGYNAALLAYVVGAGRVTSVDVDRGVLSEAWDHLRGFPDRQVILRHADGRVGYAESAPYDRIIVTAATPDLEPAWLDQLTDGGLVLAPLALAPGLAFLARCRREGGVFRGRLVRAAYFMPLRAEGETGPAEADLMRLPGELRSLPAPWAGWFDRKRPAAGWIGFIQALAFFAWLRGLSVFFRALANATSIYGISKHPSAGLCWLAPEEWQVDGKAGRDLGLTLWNSFLDAGGPRPTEFDLTASPKGGLSVQRPEGFSRQGPCCQQVWEPVESRERT
jgi:protein-L-isoaspartate(D-aspartate) O-methyltransferase